MFSKRATANNKLVVSLLSLLVTTMQTKNQCLAVVDQRVFFNVILVIKSCHTYDIEVTHGWAQKVPYSKPKCLLFKLAFF